MASAAAELPETVIALHDAGVPAPAISRTISSIHDTITRRLIELAHAELGPPPVAYTWLAMGSFGRREPFPGSDVDCALAWEGEDDGSGRAPESSRAGARRPRARAASRSTGRARLRRIRCSRARPTGWEQAARAWVEEPDRDARADAALGRGGERPGLGRRRGIAERLATAFLARPTATPFLRRLAAAALAERPPTGFLRDFVLHSSGERRGVLDIKKGGLVPIEALARWSGLARRRDRGLHASRASTASAEAGTLSADDAAILRDAFELCCALRMEHQVGQLRAGEPPDDLIAPRDLAPLTRTALKEAFRAVAKVQRGIASEHGFSAR